MVGGSENGGVKRLDLLYKTGVYFDGGLGDEPGIDGLIALGYKDDTSSEPETRFNYGYDFFKRVDSLSPLQYDISVSVSRAIGKENWLFRQARDNAAPVQPAEAELVNDLKALGNHRPLVLIYQRLKPIEIISPAEWEQYFRTEQDELANRIIEKTSFDINSYVSPRFDFRGVDAAYELHSDWGRTGEGAEDVRLLVVALYFHDNKEQLFNMKKNYTAKERALGRLGERISQLEEKLAVN
ncbi:MAG: hypothetical protein AABX51_02220 [Nanoarchaeota archaeon]